MEPAGGSGEMLADSLLMRTTSGRAALMAPSVSPTAHAPVGAAETASRRTDAEPTVGDCMTDHRWPFQCSIRPWSGATGPDCSPTAHASFGDTADTRRGGRRCYPGWGSA